MGDKQKYSWNVTIIVTEYTVIPLQLTEMKKAPTDYWTHRITHNFPKIILSKLVILSRLLNTFRTTCRFSMRLCLFLPSTFIIIVITAITEIDILQAQLDKKKQNTTCWCKKGRTSGIKSTSTVGFPPPDQWRIDKIFDRLIGDFLSLFDARLHPKLVFIKRSGHFSYLNRRTVRILQCSACLTLKLHKTNLRSIVIYRVLFNLMNSKRIIHSVLFGSSITLQVLKNTNCISDISWQCSKF